jgi:hypothetical protein
VHGRNRQSTLATWGLAVVLPILAGAAAWLVAAATVSSEACSTGSGGSVTELMGLAGLVLTAPAAIIWHARRARPLLPRIVAPVLISILLALPLVFLGAQVWWSGHNCYT